MPETKSSKPDSYNKRLREIMDTPACLADRLDALKSLGADIENHLKQHEEGRRLSGFHAAMGGMGAIAIVGGLLAAAFWSAIPVLALTMILLPTALSGQDIGQKLYDKKHETDIAALKNLKKEIAQEKDRQVESLADMPAAQLAGLARYDDLVTRHPETAGILAKAFRKSVAAPVYERPEASRIVTPARPHRPAQGPSDSHP